MFIDYLNHTDKGFIESIPPERFNAHFKATKIDKDSKISIITSLVAAIFCLVGAFLIATNPFGSVVFWVGAAEIAAGAAALLIGLCYHYTDCKKSKYHQALFLHKETTVETYQELLETDRGISYTYKTKPGFVDRHLEINKQYNANLKKQTAKELPRSLVYLFNGKTLNPGEIETKFGDFFIYANQSVISEMYFTLMSRYNNDTLNIRIQQRSFPDTPNTKFNLIEEKENHYLEVTQLFQITHLDNQKGEATCLKYLKATMKIDFQTKDAVIFWDSPQDDLPQL